MTARGAIDLDLEETDLAALLRASLAPLFEQATRDRIELRVVSLGEVPPARVDREKIAWCVATLAGNALRYVAKAGAEGSGGSVLVHLDHPGARGDVTISVQDDGPGIPDHKLPFLFERRNGAIHAEGLSLGLVREIVEAHGGAVEVESRHGEDEHGTSITLRLPHAARVAPRFTRST
jgi:signal transduction histidine kinase